MVSEILRKQDFKVQSNEGKVKSRSHHDIENPHPKLMSLPSVNILPIMVSETKPGSVFTKIFRIFLRITLKSKKNSLLRIFLFLE